MLDAFKKNIQASLWYIHFYGLIRGIGISFKFFTNSVDSIKLKRYKAPIKLRKNTSDTLTFHKVFGFREYAIKQIINEPEVIIDGGANIGLFSIFMKNLYPDSKIIAVEPDKENYNLMLTNLQCYSDIVPLNSGLWNKNSLLKAYDKYNQGKWGIVVEEVENKEESNVEGISIDEIMLRYNLTKIDILKVDIETSERYLFETNYKSWLPKVKMIIIEFHDWIVRGTAQPVFKAINETFPEYSFYMKGENAIIVNESFNLN